MSELAAILAGIDKPASYLAAARRLAAYTGPGLEPHRLGVLATFTFELLAPYLAVEGARRGLALTTAVAPFGQLEQQALDPASALYAGAPTVVVIAARLEDLAPDLVDGFVALSAAEVERAVAAYVARLVAVARAVRERSGARIVVWNQPPLQALAAGLADGGLASSQQAMVAGLSRALVVACAEIPGASVFDAARVATEVGLAQWFDAKLFHLARCPLSGAAQIAVARRLARHLRALTRPPCKVLVLDLDNTLWGGVLGEEGPGGIALGDAYPGSAYKAFQRVVRSYRDRGVLLAIASKNNPAEVDELLATHAEQLLRRDDFAALQVHWNDKASSLRAIAAALNVGVDALAFFDDNPVERAWVREQLPEVTVIDVPADPLGYPAALEASGAFDALALTDEDRARAAQYRAEAARQELAATAGSVEDFLRALEMRVAIGAIDAATAPRVVQLLAKTNQFNVTTRRHDAAALAALLAQDGAIGLWMRVTDRYGDHGLVGVALAVPEEGAAYRLDSFLMSCRVLGRQAEHALIHVLGQRIRARGGRELRGELIPTKKNAPAAALFPSTGFAPAGTLHHWTLALGADAAPPPWLEIIEDTHG